MFSPEKISYYIISLGCAKNLVDSEKLNGALQDSGFCAAENAEDADIIIINTCGFIEDAKKESIDAILEARALQSDSANGFTRKLVVAGCLSKRYARELCAEMPEIDFLYGIIDEEFLPKMCRAFDIDIQKTHLRQSPLAGTPPFAYIKISEGCSNNCSYCAIPLIRGNARAFPPAHILKDIEGAEKRGARELIIVAQDVASYRYGNTTLASLVQKICNESSAPWIRLMYCHPDHLDEEIIGLIAAEKRLCRYLDIPFQHASEKILRSMGRRGSSKKYLGLLENTRKAVPEIHLRSTFMVGYPGETDEDFRELLDFLKIARLERVGAFVYSPEEGTRASRLKGTVPRSVMRARYRRLLALQKKISAEAMRGMIGREVEVLVEERIGKDQWIGRSEFDAPEVDGIFFLTAKSVELHSIVKAEVTGAAEYDLYGVSK